jgi:hypothetical protein
MNLWQGGAWKVKPWEDAPASYSNKPPCWFHRLMLRWFFGIRWTKESD